MSENNFFDFVVYPFMPFIVCQQSFVVVVKFFELLKLTREHLSL